MFVGGCCSWDRVVAVVASGRQWERDGAEELRCGLDWHHQDAFAARCWRADHPAPDGTFAEGVRRRHHGVAHPAEFQPSVTQPRYAQWGCRQNGDEELALLLVAQTVDGSTLHDGGAGRNTLPLGGAQVMMTLLPQRVVPVGLNVTTALLPVLETTMTLVGHESVRQGGEGGLVGVTAHAAIGQSPGVRLLFRHRPRNTWRGTAAWN